MHWGTAPEAPKHLAHAFVVLMRVTWEPRGERFTQWSVPPDALMLIRRGSDPAAERLPRSQAECDARLVSYMRRVLEYDRLLGRRPPKP